ncbi:signal transduction histidine kinase [Tamaricihabitans halophyticus]|uniref:histidine kinase n=1 Tax=Tamaricihabitans halophyticus TaxID=1262583 RepID=A0A4R2QEF6_9PSEU|nr:histidine kinase [Tamaricihabitans halophyticus]TCP47377.1 signal transduction histidine kinase [Tamaricihabitans halophyticus]
MPSWILRSQSWLIDIALVAAIAVLFGASDLWSVRASWPAWLLGGSMLLALLFRRRLPRTALAVIAAATTGMVLTVGSASVGYVPLVLALYTVCAKGRRAALPLCCVAIAMVAAATVHSRGSLAGGLLVLAVASFALLLGVERQRQVTAGSRSAELRARSADADRRELAARRLHDTFARTTAVLVVQTETLRTVGQLTRSDRQRVEAILAAGRAALTEARRVVRQLADGAVEEIDLSGQLRRLRAAGLELTGVSPARGLRGVPRPARCFAERLIAEAAANVLRHGGQRAELRIARTSEAVRIELANELSNDAIANAGSGAATGLGLARLAGELDRMGGALSYGPAGGYWLVRASIPLTVETEPVGQNLAI